MMADNMYRVERESDLHGFLAAGNSAYRLSW